MFTVVLATAQIPNHGGIVHDRLDHSVVVCHSLSKRETCLYPVENPDPLRQLFTTFVDVDSKTKLAIDFHTKKFD